MADLQLILYTKLLKYRIAHSGRIDVNILQLYEAERPKSYNEHLGRFVGWFIITNGHPGLMLLARRKIGGDFTHACIMYSNTQYDEFPLSERLALSKKLAAEPNLVVTNVITKTRSFCEYSILLDTIQYVISQDIFKEPPPLYLMLEGPSLTASPDLRRIETNCSLDMTSEVTLVRQFMINKRLMLVDLDQTEPIPSSFDIMRMRYDGHYIYGINYRYEQTMMLLLPHIEQFPSDLHIVELEEKIYNRFPGCYSTFYPVRPRFATECNSATILKICILLTRIPLFYIELSDVDAVLYNLDVLSVESSPRKAPQQTPRQRNIANNSEYRGPKSTVTLRLTANSKRSEVLSVRNRLPSQALSLNSQEVIRREIDTYRAWMVLADDISSPYPSTLEAKAMHMPRDTILIDPAWFHDQLSCVTKYWAQFAASKLLQPLSISDLSVHDFERKQARFIILPVGQDSKHHNVGLMIFDKELKVWRWLHPDNSAAKARDILCDVKEKILSHFPSYGDWSGDQIILTSTFHKDYPFVHLIMGLYQTAKCFQYTVQLPLKVVYNEKSFRDYAYHYCLAVQVLNQQHNLDKGLIAEDGQLLPGSYVSLPSPIQYVQASVVPSDLCPFCKTRGYINLGRHISMKHGGQALDANTARIVQYGYSSRQ